MSFARQFAIYGVAGAASRLAAIVLVPLYTRTLSVADYGKLELLLALHAGAVILAGLQIESAIARDFFEDSNAQGRRRARVWWAVALTGAGSLACATAGLLTWGLTPLRRDIDLPTVLMLLSLTLPAQLFGVQLVLLRFQDRPLYYALMSLADLALSALFSAIFIVHLGFGVSGALLGMLCAKSLCVAMSWPATFGMPPRDGLERGIAAAMLRYGIPSIPAVLIGWAQNAGNRILLAFVLTLEDVAVAGIATKIAAIYGFVVYSYRLAWEPYAMARLNAVDEDPDIYNRSLEWYVPAMLLMAGLTVVLGPLLVRVLAPPAFAAGGWLAMYFVLGQFWSGMTQLLAIGIHRARRTGLLLPVFGLGALVNVALLAAAAPVAGVSAAGMAFLAGSMASALLACRYSNGHLVRPFNARLLAATACATCVLAVAWLAVRAMGTAATTFGGAAAMVAVGCIVVFAVVFAVVSFSFAPGRPAQMWARIRSALRQTGRFAS